VVEGPDAKLFKLLLRDDSTQQELDSAVEAFFDFMSKLHRGQVDEHYHEQLAAQMLGPLVLVACSQETRAIEVLDPRPKRS
jgi:hypothetical protein